MLDQWVIRFLITKYAIKLGLKKFLGKMAFQSGIANCTEYFELIQLVIDNEATRTQEVYLNRHLKICATSNSSKSWKLAFRYSIRNTLLR